MDIWTKFLSILLWVISKLLIKVNKSTYPITTNIVWWMWNEETVQTEQIRDLDNTAGKISKMREVIFTNLYEIHCVAHIHTTKGNLTCCFLLFSFKQSRLIPHTHRLRRLSFHCEWLWQIRKHGAVVVSPFVCCYHTDVLLFRGTSSL